MRDALAGAADLNWSPDVPMESWGGITLGGSPTRVVTLNVRDQGLNGEIPSEFSSLASLEQLNLGQNRLQGTIPSELANLARLNSLELSGNQLSGCVPDGLKDVPDNDLDALGLLFCDDVGTRRLPRLYLRRG